METRKYLLDLPADTHAAYKELASEVGIPAKGLIRMILTAAQDIPPDRINEALASVKKFSDPSRASVRSGQLEMVP